MTSPRTSTTSAIAVTTPVSYDDLVLHNLIKFRGPDGSRRDVFATVANPALPSAVRAAHQKIPGQVNVALGATLLACLGGFLAPIAAGVAPGDPHLWLMDGPLAAVMGAGIATEYRLVRRQRRLEDQHSFRLRVPDDVASAYQAFLAAPGQLRANGADAEVLAEVAAQAELMHALVVEVAALVRRGATNSVAYGQLCDRVVHLGAQAKAVVTMDCRRTELAAVVGESPALLAREQASLGRAAGIVEAEVAHLDRVLDGTDTLAELPATQSRA